MANSYSRRFAPPFQTSARPAIMAQLAGAGQRARALVAVAQTMAESRARRRLDRDQLAWVVVGVVVVACFALRKEVAWLAKYPVDWTLPLGAWVQVFMNWFVEHFKWLFTGITWLLQWPLDWITGLLQWLPWPATIAVFAVSAFVSAGWRLALFTVLALFYMLLIGFWLESMRTLALVFVSVPISLAIGLFVGIGAFKSPRFNRVVQPSLDLMQTFPTFAYLLPIMLLFGFGAVVGLIASAIYASPPMVRNVILGLQRVPTEVVESALMSGTTKGQLLWWVQVPTARSNIMMGVNQTMMAALSMVIIAAFIGGSADIGWEVLQTIRKAQFGEGLIAGSVIVLIAMVMDRTSRGFVGRERLAQAPGGSVWSRHRPLWVVVGTAIAFIALSKVFPVLKTYPNELVFYPAEPLNVAVDYLTGHYAAIWEGIKKYTLFFFLLPLRIGLESSVRPMSWGFALTPGITAGYAIAIGVFAVLCARALSWRAAVGVILIGGWMYFGISMLPWPAFALVVTLLAWQVGGWRLALFALLGQAFLAVAGFWDLAMRSIYLCAAAVLTSFIIGGLLGVWAARNDRVSAFVRPINDTLQTMPLFVFLIPVLMFFQVGEFTAYLAIIMYAIVPSIRYTEQGLRDVPPEIVEAARACGCSNSQMLWQVKLPLAIPEIMLGLNQTVMYGLAMLIVAALVGTRGLGQQVFISLGMAEAGQGIVAGLGITLIAMITDRIIQAWSARRKAALGL